MKVQFWTSHAIPSQPSQTPPRFKTQCNVAVLTARILALVIFLWRESIFPQPWLDHVHNKFMKTIVMFTSRCYFKPRNREIKDCTNKITSLGLSLKLLRIRFLLLLTEPFWLDHIWATRFCSNHGQCLLNLGTRLHGKLETANLDEQLFSQLDMTYCDWCIVKMGISREHK